MPQILLIAVMATTVILVGWFTCQHGKNGADATTIQNGEVKLHGRISDDSCFTNGGVGKPPIGDAGCSITVNGYEVPVTIGNIRPSAHPGTVTGLTPAHNQTGEHADVYGKLVDAHTVSIWESTKYYVRISK